MSKNYYDFAEDDFDFVVEAYKNGWVRNSMCSISQKVCERFLKHIIEAYFIPDNEADRVLCSDVMKTHSLRKLERFLKEKMDIEPDIDVHTALQEVNGFYYETSYPGDESFFVNKEDVEIAVKSMEKCKAFVDELILSRNKG